MRLLAGAVCKIHIMAI